MKNYPVFMAFSHGKKTVEQSTSFTNYIGVGAVNIIAVNPNKKELSKIYNRDFNDEPKYFGEQTQDGKTTKYARITFVVRTAPGCSCNNDIDLTTQVTFFIKNEPQYNRDKTKIKVIDKYGRTAWPTIDQAKSNIIPTYISKKDGKEYPLNIDKDYRPAYVGEEELTNFIIAYLNIPNPMVYDSTNNTWNYKSKEELADSAARLDEVKKYFTGDISELKNIISYQPSNIVKVLIGVRTTDDNKQYQSVYTNMFLTNRSNNYAKLAKDVQDRYAAGAMQSIEYKVQDLQEYKVEATDFNTSESKEQTNPFEDTEDGLPF